MPRTYTLSLRAAALSLAAVAALSLSACSSDGGSSSSSESSASASASKACEQPAASASTLSSAPEVEWTGESGQIKRPTSEEYGPASTEDSVPTCFQHSPAGALVAATTYEVVFLNDYAAGDYSRLQQLVRAGVVDDSARSTLLKEMASDAPSATPVPSHSSLLEKMKVAGYKVESYSQDSAEVTVVVQRPVTGATSYEALTVTEKWSDGDWKITAKSLDDESNSKTLTSLSGYTAWGPESSSASASEGASASASS